jgi:hypothetical protein
VDNQERGRLEEDVEKGLEDEEKIREEVQRITL